MNPALVTLGMTRAPFAILRYSSAPFTFFLNLVIAASTLALISPFVLAYETVASRPKTRVEHISNPKALNNPLCVLMIQSSFFDNVVGYPRRLRHRAKDSWLV